MTVRDIRLPEDIERNVVGGPGFKTKVTTFVSGREERNIDWQRTRGRWDARYGIQTKDDMLAVVEMFYVSWGMAYGFRFKDWWDFELGDDATDAYQSVGAGDGAETDFQVYKRYQVGSFIYDRTLTRLVSGTVRVFLGGVEQGSGWTADVNTGIVTFDVAPGNGVDVGVICEFDVPVRFGTDELDIDMEVFNAGSLPSIPLVEIKEGP